MRRPDADHASARRAALVATIWAPLAIVVASEIIIIAVGATNGHDLIIGWGPDGVSTAPWWTYAILVAAMGIPVIAVMGLFVVRGTRMVGANAWIPAIAMGITVFHAIGMGVGSVVLNASPLAPALPLAGGAVLAVIVTLITWWVLPREAAADDHVEAADTLPVRAGEIAAWTGRVELPGWLVAIIATAASALIAVGLILILTRGPHTWPIFIRPTLLLTVLALTAQFVVSAGPRGFVLRSAAGWPRIHVATSDLAKAGVIIIDPMSDFGGWGLRWVIGPTRKGRIGVLTRRGRALEVFRRDGRSIVVTVDDADTAASVLETYANQQTNNQA